MVKPPLGKDAVDALKSLSRAPVKSRNADESMMQQLSSQGLAQEKLGTWKVTARGKMNLQRRTSLRRTGR